MEQTGRRQLEQSLKLMGLRASQAFESGDRLLPVASKGRGFSQAELGKRGVGVLRQFLSELVLGGLGESVMEQDCPQFGVELRLTR